MSVYIDVADAKHAEENAKLIQAWATAPPGDVQPPWIDVLSSARVQVRGDGLQVHLRPLTEFFYLVDFARNGSTGDNQDGG